jgi:hypothetical protein
MKIKKTVSLLVVFSFIALAASLITCVNPFAPNEEEQNTLPYGKGAFTISIGNNNVKTNNSRAVFSYPPKPDEIANLKFIVNFTPLAGGKAQTFSVAGNKDLRGYIDIGHYKVTMDILDVSDNSKLYARGVAEYNPVEIKAEDNFIHVFAYGTKNAEPPVVSEQPQGATYHVGATAEAMKVTVDTPKDGGTIKYQWYSNTENSNSGGTKIDGETLASYTPSKVTEKEGNTHYYVMITNYKEGSSETSIPSKAVRIYVGNNAETPEITEPDDVTVSFGKSLTLTVKASVDDGGTLSYQWYRNTVDNNTGGTPISGATSETYTPPTTEIETIYYYYVVVTNTNNAAPGLKTAKETSRAVKVTISEGSGSSEDPFIVYNPDTLQRVGKGTGEWASWSLSMHYKQVRDIDMTEQTFTPIGTSDSNAFIGSYDGGGHIISNLAINNPSSDYQGLFGHIKSTDAIIKNIGLVNCDIKGKERVGGVAGDVSSGTVEYCYVTGDISGTVYVGGVVGYNRGILQNCYFSGDISGTNIVGGVVGSSTLLKNCYATGTVSGNNEVGGVVGNQSTYFTYNCYAICAVSGNNNVGGVTGNNNARNCVALNPNVSTSSYVSRVTPYYTNGLTNNYGRSDMAKNGLPASWTSNKNSADGADITEADWGRESWWKTESNWNTTDGVSKWDFETIWEWGGKLPILRNMPAGTQNPTVQPIPPLNVSTGADWTAVCNAISGAGNGTADKYKNYTINIINDFETAGTNSVATFGTLTYINVTITGNHTIKLTGQGSLLYIFSNQNVVIRDTHFDGNENNFDYDITLVIVNGTNGHLTMEGNSSVSNNKSKSQGSGVSVRETCIFTMKDNASVNNNYTTFYGGGVSVYGGTFNMTGGTISGNNTEGTGGGGVFVGGTGTFNMTGGTILSNTASPYGGGGVYISRGGTFNMTGGTISKNEANDSDGGGGVYVYGGTFNMSGGTISDNSTSSQNGSDSFIYGGGGVRVINYGIFNMSGTAVITGNNATNGGGVHVYSPFSSYGDWGIFNMTGGTISKNSVNYKGGGVGVDSSGTFRMVAGTIYGSNEAVESLRNTAITGAALEGTVQLGTFSGTPFNDSTWTSKSNLTTENNTLNVVNGVVVPLQ